MNAVKNLWLMKTELSINGTNMYNRDPSTSLRMT